MATSYYGPMRASDADREKVHAALQAAYADGRLTWEEFDSRSTKLVAAKTHGQLSTLTRDLRQPVPYQPTAHPAGLRPTTNNLAGISFGFGLGQFFFPFFGAIIAVVCGHVARRQMRRTGEQGDGLATAGIVLGYIGIAISLLIAALIVYAVKGLV